MKIERKSKPFGAKAGLSANISARRALALAENGYVTRGHPSVKLTLLSGQVIDVDEGVVELIKLMNDIPGIETRGSCQGDDSVFGYVQFAPDSTEGKGLEPILFMQHTLQNVWSAWLRLSGTDLDRFEFKTELGNGYVLKWSPSTYQAVLAAAKMAVVRTERDTT